MRYRTKLTALHLGDRSKYPGGLYPAETGAKAEREAKGPSGRKKVGTVKKSGAYGEAYNRTTVGAVMGTVNAPDEFAQAVAQALPGEEPYHVDIETDEDEKKVTVRTHGHGTTNIRVFRQTDEGLEVDHEYFRMPQERPRLSWRSEAKLRWRSMPNFP
jgi:hypothetical protein